MPRSETPRPANWTVWRLVNGRWAEAITGTLAAVSPAFGEGPGKRLLIREGEKPEGHAGDDENDKEDG